MQSTDPVIILYTERGITQTYYNWRFQNGRHLFLSHRYTSLEELAYDVVEKVTTLLQTTKDAFPDLTIQFDPREYCPDPSAKFTKQEQLAFLEMYKKILSE